MLFVLSLLGALQLHVAHRGHSRPQRGGSHLVDPGEVIDADVEDFRGCEADQVSRNVPIEKAEVIENAPVTGCNGVVCFDDLGELLPDGSSLPARRPIAHYGHHGAAA